MMKRHALFVGVDQYADPTIQNLAYPAEDATELASVFRRLLKFDRVEKLSNPAHASDVVDAVKDMTKGLGPGDLFLFFFAGHGFRVKENHVLVCAKDEFADLEDEYAGLPVGLLKKRMRGSWDRMLVLDACQNDIRATRGADRGVASRDLALIHTSDDGTPGSGFQIVVTACSEGQKALEVADLGHGLFTSAFLDSVTAFADARRRIDLEALRTDLGGRMGQLIAQYRLSGKQEPMFTMPADAGGIVLLDGVVSGTSPQTSEAPRQDTTAAPKVNPQPRPRIRPRFPVGTKAGERRTVEILDNVAMDFVWCPATTDDEWKKISIGAETFTMGSPIGEIGRKADEFLHPVRLTHGFWIATCPVMQIQWENVMGAMANRSPMMKGAEKPVTNVSYEDATEFIEKIRDFGCPVALPTEAQWEYACRAGKGGSFGAGETGFFVPRAKRPGWFAMGLNVAPCIFIPVFGWIAGVIKLAFFGGRSVPLKQFQANNWGLYDMHGNCGEWCVDWYGPYPSAEVTDPRGPESGPGHVVRGMRRFRWYLNCRSAARWWLPTKNWFRRYRNPLAGLRLVINPVG